MIAAVEMYTKNKNELMGVYFNA